MSGELTKRGNDFLWPQVKYGQLGRDKMKQRIVFVIHKRFNNVQGASGSRYNLFKPFERESQET